MNLHLCHETGHVTVQGYFLSLKILHMIGVDDQLQEVTLIIHAKDMNWITAATFPCFWKDTT
jgi:hypothetical protein